MKGSSDRTKVVLRHLPPGISESTLIEQVDRAFAGRYNWVSFLPGKSGEKHQSYSRAYIDFKNPEGVLEFAEFFNGHVFVNENGAQFKTIVEYAPSQRVAKQSSKRDAREGTIAKDPEYLEFLEFLAKPVENLPSAEIQLERREAERAGAPKDIPIVTPLMDFVRQKRAAKSGSRRSLSNGKLGRRSATSSGASPSSASSKRVSDKRKGSTKMYVQRDASKNSNGKEKSTYILVPKRDDQIVTDKAVKVSSAETELLEVESGISGITDGGKKKVLLLKGKEREIPNPMFTPSKKILGSTVKQNSRHEGSGRLIRSILLNKDASSATQAEQQMQTSNQEKDKQHRKPSYSQLVLKDENGSPEDKLVRNELHDSYSEKPERHGRNKDRPDRNVRALRRSDGSYPTASDQSMSSSISHFGHSTLESFEGVHADTKVESSTTRVGTVKTLGSGRNSSLDNCSHKHGSRRGSVSDGPAVASDGKPLKRGSASGYGSHEKQVWVQKSSSGS